MSWSLSSIISLARLHEAKLFVRSMAWRFNFFSAVSWEDSCDETRRRCCFFYWMCINKQMEDRSCNSNQLRNWWRIKIRKSAHVSNWHHQFVKWTHLITFFFWRVFKITYLSTAWMTLFSSHRDTFSCLRKKSRKCIKNLPNLQKCNTFPRYTFFISVSCIIAIHSAASISKCVECTAFHRIQTTKR